MIKVNAKVLVVGDEGIGKECICHVFDKEKSLQDLDFCVPESFLGYLKNIVVQGYNVKAWVDILKDEDTDEDICSIQTCNVDVALLCFAVNKPQTLQNIKDKWLQDVQYYCPGVSIVLVGTMGDLRMNCHDDSNTVLIDTSYAATCATQFGACGYVECSSLYNTGIQEAFRTGIYAMITKVNKVG